MMMTNVTLVCATLDVANQCALRVSYESAQLDMVEMCEACEILIVSMGYEMAARMVRVLWREWQDRNCAWRL